MNANVTNLYINHFKKYQRIVCINFVGETLHVDDRDKLMLWIKAQFQNQSKTTSEKIGQLLLKENRYFIIINSLFFSLLFTLNF